MKTSRRKFLAASLMTSAGLLYSRVPAWSTPMDGRKPVSFPHFPSTLHAFVWRNWELVPVENMAKVVQTSVGNIKKIAISMGLDATPIISDEQWARSYITIIRRNWHLLPKDQLQELLGWTAEHLAFTLKEDDFLDVKLGRKPDCPRIVYVPSSDQIKAKERWFVSALRKHTVPIAANKKEPLFQFVKDLSKPLEVAPKAISNSGFSPRYGYAYFMLFGDPLLETKVDPYPIGYLQRMKQAGMDGTWMHIVLSKLTPFPWDPSKSLQWQVRLENLKKLVAKCKEHGIGIYLYLNEPRYQPMAFYEKYPDLKGVQRGNEAALCTSVPEVQNYLKDSIALITENVPDLAGFFSISASENTTHCWSHMEGNKCPRCSKRTPGEVVSELHQLYRKGIEEGVRRHESKNAGVKIDKLPKLIVWDWGWPNDWAAQIVPNLPKDSSLMSVSEWELPINRGGVSTEVGEYSISAVGPGPRAKRHWAIARNNGLKIIAKIQAGTTWELGAVPYIPAVENVAQHAYNLREEQVSGLMTGWTLGGYPDSPNLEVVARIGEEAGLSVDDAMERVAARRYGPVSKQVVAIWKQFSAAFREFPYHIRIVYKAPVHSGPANLLYSNPTAYKATMVGIGYDDLASWTGAIYPEEVFIQQLDKVADGFRNGIASLEQLLKVSSLTGAEREQLQRETQVATAVYLHYASVSNQARFVGLRELVGKGSSADIKAKLRKVVTQEIELAKKMYRLQSIDSRIGFEASNHYFYIPSDLREKIVNCQYLLDNWIPNL